MAAMSESDDIDSLVPGMPAHARAEVAFVAGGQPTELDLRRITRGLADRVRYRYVSPTVIAQADGYRVVSPCCSRRIDPHGGEIEIAWIEALAGGASWRLHSRDHAQHRWVAQGEFVRLHELLAKLNRDLERVFWP